MYVFRNLNLKKLVDLDMKLYHFLLMHILQAEYVITYHDELINYGVRLIFAQIISNLQRNLVFQVQCWMQLL